MQDTVLTCQLNLALVYLVLCYMSLPATQKTRHRYQQRRKYGNASPLSVPSHAQQEVDEAANERGILWRDRSFPSRIGMGRVTSLVTPKSVRHIASEMEHTKSSRWLGLLESPELTRGLQMIQRARICLYPLSRDGEDSDDMLSKRQAVEKNGEKRELDIDGGSGQANGRRFRKRGHRGADSLRRS